jgi:hypothetical protein
MNGDYGRLSYYYVADNSFCSNLASPAKLFKETDGKTCLPVRENAPMSVKNAGICY